MADDEDIKTEEEESDEDGDVSPAEEFRALYQQSEELSSNLKRVAMSMQQGGENAAAEVLRQVAGEVMEFIGEVIAATGYHLDALDEGQAASGDGIPIEDAKSLYRTLFANNKLWKDVHEQAASSQRETIEKMIEMNEDSMRLVVDLSGEDDLPRLIEKEAQRVSVDGSGSPN